MKFGSPVATGHAAQIIVNQNQNQNQNILMQTTRSIYTNITTYKIDTDIQRKKRRKKNEHSQYTFSEAIAINSLEHLQEYCSKEPVSQKS